MKIATYTTCLTLGFCAAVCCDAKTSAGGPEEPVRYIGGETVDTNHEGGLRLAVGVKNWQAFRANREHPELAEDFGWTYNHAPNIAWWNNRFWIQYLSGPVHENKGHGQVTQGYRLVTVASGIAGLAAISTVLLLSFALL